MKKIRKIQVIALCFAILLGTFSVPMRAEAAFNKKEIKQKLQLPTRSCHMEFLPCIQIRIRQMYLLQLQ